MGKRRTTSYWYEFQQRGCIVKQPIIEIKNLRKFFGTYEAVKSINITINGRSRWLFIGSNGAGKTTTMRILCTLDDADSGQVFVKGKDISKYPDHARKLIGWMPDDVKTYPDMSVIDYLDFFARTYNFKGAEREKRIQDTMEFTELLPSLPIDPVINYQKGRLREIISG